MIDYLSLLNCYEQMFGKDHRLAAVRDQIDTGENVIDRKNMHGHCTVRSVVFNKDYTKILVIYHKAFDSYIYPWGHIDDMIEHPRIHAQREAIEETWVVWAILHPWHSEHSYLPLSIERHFIPLNLWKWEGDHYHCGMCYVFVADETIPLPIVADDGTSDPHWESIYTLNDFMTKQVQTVCDRLWLSVSL